MVATLIIDNCKPRMPRYARESEKRSTARAAGVCPKTPNAVQIDGQIDLAHISNILEDAIDVLKNDNTTSLFCEGAWVFSAYLFIEEWLRSSGKW